MEVVVDNRVSDGNSESTLLRFELGSSVTTENSSERDEEKSSTLDKR